MGATATQASAAPHMAHPDKSHTHTRVLDAISRAPWWVGVVLALLIGAVLHLASPVGSEAAGSGQGVDSGLTVLSEIAQVVLPLLCLGAAWLSATRRRSRRVPPAPAVPKVLVPGWDPMAPGDFESLVAQAFRLQGFHVTEVAARGRPDRDGVALVLRMNRETHLVRSQDWQQARVPVGAVESLHRAMQARDAAGGYALTSGRFTREAHAFASGGKIRLIEGRALTLLMENARCATSRPAANTGSAPPEAGTQTAQ